MSQDGKKNLRQTEDPSGGFPGVVPPQMAGTARDMRAVPEKGGSTSLGARCSLLAVTSPRGRREAHPAPSAWGGVGAGGRLSWARSEQNHLAELPRAHAGRQPPGPLPHC